MSLRPNIKITLAAVLATVSSIALLSAFWTLPPRIDRTVHSEIGATLAAEALKLLKPGGKVTVIARDTEAFPQPAMDLLIKRLERDVRRAGAEIKSIEHIQLDPIRPGEVPSGDFYELLRRLPAGDVIISLLGPPLLLPEHREKLGRPKGGLVALCTGSVADKSMIENLLNSGLLHAAIINQPAPSGTGANSFARLYAVVRGK